MRENKHTIGSNLKKVDAHIITPEEYEEMPEWTPEQWTAAEIREGGKLIRRGRPPSASRKESVKLRLHPEVLEYFRSTGQGWQTLIGSVLLKYTLRQLKAVNASAKKTAPRSARRRVAAAPPQHKRQLEHHSRRH